MSSSVDNRIVQMTFDNKQFENGVQTSLNTLSKLNDALKFNDGVGINNIASSLEGLNQKFSTLGIIGANVVSRLTQEFMNNLLPIINTVSRTIGSLTFNFETMTESFGKYEQMVTNQQTIMSAVGDKINKITGELYNMDDVADIIDRLRWYTDETSYNLDQMVGAIGDFTASGIDLADAEKMIIGIANACADAGISADKADIAMRGFSRAIGSGGLTLQVWNTMLKTSGITNSERFRQSLIDAAVAQGTLTKSIAKNGDVIYKTNIKGMKKVQVTLANITDTLTEYGWANNKVLERVLAEYSNTVDGIYALTNGGPLDLTTSAFEKLRKEMEKQGKTLEDLGLDQQYDQASEAIAALTNAYEELGIQVPKSLKAFTRAQEAVSLTQAIDATATAVRSQWAKTFELIFGNYEEAKRLWTGVSNSLWGIFAGGGDERNDFLEEWHFNRYEDFADGVITSFLGIENAMNAVRTMFKYIVETDPGSFFADVSETLSDLTIHFSEAAYKFEDITSSISMLVDYLPFLQDLKDYLSDPSSWIENDENYGVLDDLMEKFEDIETVVKFMDIVEDLKNTFRGFVSVFDLAKQAVSGFWRATEPLRELLGQIAIKILEATGSFGEWIAGLSKSAKESDFFYNVFKKLVDIIMGVGVPAFELLSNIFKNVKEFLAPLGDLFSNTKEAVKEFLGSISDKNVERIKNLTDFFKLLGDILGRVVDKIFSAAKRISAAFKEIFDGISLKEIGELANTGLLTAILYKIFNKKQEDSGSFLSGIKGIIEQVSSLLSTLKDTLVAYQESLRANVLLKIAAAIGILALALVQLSKIDSSNLSTAIIGMASLFAELAIMMNYLSGMDESKSNKRIKGLIKISASLLVLSYALRNIGGMKWSEILRGVVGLGLVMAELILATKYMDRMKANPKGLIGLAAALLVFALDMKIIGNMNWDEIIRGVSGIGIILAELALFFAAMNAFGGGAIKTLAAAAAIAVISASMLVFAGVLKILATMDQEQIGKGLIAIGIGLAEFAIAAALMKDALPAAAALLIMSSAIVVLTPALVTLGLLSWESIAKGLITLAGALAIFVAAGKLLKGSEVTILAFSAAIALAGVGIAAFAIGITTLAAGLSAGAVIIAESLVLIISSLASLIPTIIEKIGEGIIAVIDLIGNSATAIVEAAVQIGMALLIGIEELIPKIIETGVTVILSLLQGIADNIYQIVILAGKIVTEFLDGIAEVIPNVIDSGLNLIGSFINGMADGIVEHTDEILDAVGRLMTAISYFVISALDNLTKDIPLIGDKIHGKLSEIKADLEKEMSKEEGEKIGSNISSGVATGIEKNQSKAITAAGNLAAKTLKAAKDKLGIQSPSKAFAEVGKYADEGLAEGMYRFTSKVTDASSSIADSALTALENPMKNIADIVSDEIGMDPVITPVLDLSQIQNGARNIGSMFGTTSIRGIGSIGGYYGGSVNDGGAYSPTVNVTIYASEGQTSDDLYDTFTRRLNSDVRRRSLLWE